jgi:predicted membrane metal-binding protein
MSSGFLISALAVISVLTSLTVEAIKKLLNERGAEYSSNLLAAIVAILITVAVCFGYVLYFGIPFTIQIVVIMVALMFLAFLSATVGYDKVRQLLEQIK